MLSTHLPTTLSQKSPVVQELYLSALHIYIFRNFLAHAHSNLMHPEPHPLVPAYGFS